MRLLLLLLLNVLAFPSFAQKTLFPIVENGRHGFIDSTGKIIVPPKFNALQPFSEGLAAARLGGYYGYIDSMGSWVIPPQYEYATAFSEGLAVAFKQGEPFYINHKGSVPFIVKESTELALFKNGFAFIKSGQKLGIINKQGKTVAKPVFDEIFKFNKGLFRVTTKYPKQRYYSMGLIDSLGHWVIPLGKYAFIQPFVGGFAKVGVIANKRKLVDDGFINQNYELCISLRENDTFRLNGNCPFVQDSVFVVSCFHKKLVEKQEITYYNDGLMNLKGQILLDSPLIERLEPIGNGIFQGISHEQDTCFIDTKGQLVDRSKVDLLAPNPYKNVFQRPEPRNDDEDKFLKLETNNVRMTYIDDNDSIIWQAKNLDSTIDTLNIDFLKRGQFYAHSTSKANDEGFGDWGDSTNNTDSITQAMNFRVNTLSLSINTSDILHIENKWVGYKVYIANTTNNTIHFDAQDSRLYMNMQALDAQNNWRDIEYLPSSWCGNSYHTLALDPQHFWQFQMPVFKGSMPTRIRIKLKLTTKGKNKGKDKDKEFYSNEIEASVNPAQFWRKEDYSPSGIMDPYND